MSAAKELERLQRERDTDTEWLGKYKTIIDGLQMIADIEEGGGDTIDYLAVISIGCGLAYVSKLIDEDIKGRKESEVAK